MARKVKKSSRSVAKKVVKRAAKVVAKRAVKHVVKKAAVKRGRGRPRGFGPAPRSFKDRFQKFYYEHRDRLNKERRGTYGQKKKVKICVRCKKHVVKGSIFCASHRSRSREYNAR